MRDFTAEKCADFPAEAWKRAREEAESWPVNVLYGIVGSDISPEVLRLASYHARRAKVNGGLHFQLRPVAEGQFEV